MACVKCVPVGPAAEMLDVGFKFSRVVNGLIVCAQCVQCYDTTRVMYKAS
jgi:hypothetical protein